MSEGPKHRNDIYGDIEKKRDNVSEAIPAATVVLLRDTDSHVEVLMLHRTSKVHFGGMWVFPGGRIDPPDFPANGDIEVAARNAAVRETAEESGLVIGLEDFVYFAHWTPPASTPRRYATWFFAGAIADAHGEISVDGHEIQDHEWIRPLDALTKHAAGEIDLAPPTWITLHQLSLYKPAASVIDQLEAMPRKIYETRVALSGDGTRIAMWAGDAGYEIGEADVPGERHRLVMAEHGFRFENTVEPY